MFKTLFLFDPAMRDAADWETLTGMVVPLLQSAGVAPENFEFQSRPIGFFFSAWRVGGDYKYQSDRNILSNGILAFFGRIPRLSLRGDREDTETWK
jgi:hypothetical protein